MRPTRALLKNLRKSALICGYFLFLLRLIPTAHAQAVPLVSGTTPHYAVTIAATLTTELDTSGSTATSHAVAVNNTSLLKAIFLSGSSGVAKASDMDIVITLPSLEVDVINKATLQTIAVLGQMGAGAVTNGFLLTTSKSGASITSIFTDYEFTFAAAPSPERVNVTAHVNEPVASGANATGLTFSFIGGNNTSNNPQNIFQGTLRKATKVYTY